MDNHLYRMLLTLTSFYRLYLILFVLMILYIIYRIVRICHRHKEYLKRQEVIKLKLNHMNNNIKAKTDELNSLIRSVMDKAYNYGDTVTPELIVSLIDRIEEELSHTDNYDEIMKILSHAKEEVFNLRDAMEKHKREIDRGLKEEVLEKEEKRKKYPFYDTRFFKSCTDIESVKKTFRKLVKVYHPDVGGDEKEYIKLQEEYQQITGRR